MINKPISAPEPEPALRRDEGEPPGVATGFSTETKRQRRSCAESGCSYSTGVGSLAPRPKLASILFLPLDERRWPAASGCNLANDA